MEITILIGLLIFIVGYAISKFLLAKVESLASVAEILAIAIGAVLALSYTGLM